jgi:hypothetical protein
MDEILPTEPHPTSSKKIRHLTAQFTNRLIGIVTGGLSLSKAMAPAAQHTNRVRWPITYLMTNRF